MTRHLPFALVGLFTCIGLTGCYTTKNVVTLSPLETKYPVSASGAYVDGAGNVVDAKQYGGGRSFEFERTVKAPRHATTETRLVLEQDLDTLVAQNGGDAVTDLKIEGVGYDPGSHYSSALWKQWGWGFGITGGTLLVVGATNESLKDSFVPAGLITGGIGVLSYVLGVTRNDPAEWKFKVSGRVVKRNGAAVAAPPTAGPAAASEAAAP